MKIQTLLALAILTASACGTATSGTKNLTKAEAQTLAENGNADDDVCTSNGFNEDEVCDDWCPDGDQDDCSVSNMCTAGESKNADDGCNTCTCGADGSWACTEIGCDPDDNNGDNGAPLALEIGDCPTDGDAISITGVDVKGDILQVDAGFSGGCAEHVVTACWDGSFLESNPVQARIVLHHNANGDMCEAYLQQTFSFDLTDMKQTYIDGYQTSTGTILIGVADAPEGAQYDF